MSDEKQTDAYFKALYYLNKACKLAQKIKQEEIKSAVLNEFVFCKKTFKKDFLIKNFAHIAKKIVILYENIDEVLADCEQEDLNVKIVACIEKMTHQFSEEEIDE